MARFFSRYKDTPRYITERARALRQNMTPVEEALWRHLSNRKLDGLRFRRQHPIGRYIVDFCTLDVRLVVELDGDIHEQQQEYDANRSDFLKGNGFAVVRSSNDEVLNSVDQVLGKIRTEVTKLSSRSLQVPLRGI